MEILLENGADVNHRSSTGQTPLMKAVGSRNIAAIECLLKSKADASIKTPSGMTAASISEVLNERAILDRLIQANSG